MRYKIAAYGLTEQQLMLLDIAGINSRYESAGTGITFILSRCLRFQIRHWQEYHWLTVPDAVKHKPLFRIVFTD